MTLKYERWPAEHRTEMLRLRAAGLDYRAVAAALNAQFGTARTRKTCANHVRDFGQRSPVRKLWSKWPAGHDDMLKRLLPTLSHSKIADALNKEFGTNYTRNSCIGRADRLALTEKSPRIAAEPRAQRLKRANDTKREKRWAENPSLEAIYKRRQEMAANRKKMLGSGRSKTSREYRIHMPKVGNMTKGELRAMLSQALQNTAAMEIAA